MDQIGIRCPNNLPAPIAQAQTKIHIVKVVREILVKTAEVIEDRFSQVPCMQPLPQNNFATKRTSDSSARSVAAENAETHGLPPHAVQAPPRHAAIFRLDTTSALRLRRLPTGQRD